MVGLRETLQEYSDLLLLSRTIEGKLERLPFIARRLDSIAQQEGSWARARLLYETIVQRISWQCPDASMEVRMLLNTSVRGLGDGPYTPMAIALYGEARRMLR
jgi:hypothetical protein